MAAHTRSSRSPAIALAAGLALGVTPPAQSGWLDMMGEPVPEISARTWYDAGSEHSEPLSAASLKGKVWLLEFFLCSSAPCMAKVVPLSRLHDKFKDRGFRVVAISENRGSTLRKMMEQHKPTYYIGWDPEDETRRRFSTFGAISFPRFYLINARGEIVGHDIPSEAALETLLEDVFDSALPQLHDGLKAAVDAFEWGAYGAAHAAAQALTESEDPAIAADAAKLIAHVEKLAEHKRTELEYAREKNGLYADIAYGRLLCMEFEFDGLALAEWAKKERKKLQRDDRVKEHKRAWSKLEDAIEREMKGRTQASHLRRARQLYDDTIEKAKYEEPGKIAIQRLERLPK